MGDDVACSYKWSLTQAGTKVIKLPQSFLTGHTTLITQSTLGQRSSSPQKKDVPIVILRSERPKIEIIVWYELRHDFYRHLDSSLNGRLRVRTVDTCNC